MTINELFAAHLDYAEKHYRRADGTVTSEVDAYKRVYKITRELYGDTPAAEFGPLALKATRQAMIQAGWCRTRVNQQIGKLKRILKWSAAEELIPHEVYQRLTAVTGLQLGRTEARESQPIGPVDDAVVDATLPFLNRHVRGLVEFQRLTGCRPGEACIIRRSDIDTGGKIWLYRPAYHKLAYRGSARVISIGPKAQQLIRDYFTPNLDDYLFSPRRAREERYAALREKRRTKVQPSQVSRRNAKAKKLPGERYARTSYCHAIYKAAEKAGVESWHPNQLRHLFATRVRKAHGLEAAQVLLGHARANTTEIYAERNQVLPATVAEKVG
jgi:integrase